MQQIQSLLFYYCSMTDSLYIALFEYLHDFIIIY